jgi:hypothetical protein
MSARSRDDLFSNFQSTITLAGKMKRKMLAIKADSARIKCTECEGTLHGRISGSRQHFRMWCDGACKRAFME